MKYLNPVLPFLQLCHPAVSSSENREYLKQSMVKEMKELKWQGQCRSVEGKMFPKMDQKQQIQNVLNELLSLLKISLIFSRREKNTFSNNANPVCIYLGLIEIAHMTSLAP